MSIRIQKNNKNVDFQAVADLLDHVGLSHYDKETQRKVFENSYAVAYVYDEEQLIGCARAISDGICQAAIYNVAVADGYRGQQLGRRLIQTLLDQLSGCTVILYTHPKTVAFYEKLDFRRQKTGFVYYNGSKDLEEQGWLENTGFLLPEGYRYEKDESLLYDERGELMREE